MRLVVPASALCGTTAAARAAAGEQKAHAMPCGMGYPPMPVCVALCANDSAARLPDIDTAGVATRRRVAKGRI
jgi:hypothetical protein